MEIREVKIKDITKLDELLLSSFMPNTIGDILAMDLLFEDKFCYVKKYEIGYLYFNGKQWSNEIFDSVLFTAVVRMIQTRKKLGQKYQHERLIKHSVTNFNTAKAVFEAFKKFIKEHYSKGLKDIDLGDDVIIYENKKRKTGITPKKSKVVRLYTKRKRMVKGLGIKGFVPSNYDGNTSIVLPVDKAKEMKII